MARGDRFAPGAIILAAAAAVIAFATERASRGLGGETDKTRR
jgi:hypothetical protein